MSEVKWFRLLVVAILGTWLGAGSVWAYNKWTAYTSHEQVLHWSALAQESLEKCLAHNPGFSVDACKNKWWTNLTDDYVAEQSEAEEQAAFATWFLWLPPLVLTFLFYGVRWAITDRIRPLWLIKLSSEN